MKEPVQVQAIWVLINLPEQEVVVSLGVRAMLDKQSILMEWMILSP